MRPPEAVEVELHQLGVLQLKLVGLSGRPRHRFDPECGIDLDRVCVAPRGLAAASRKAVLAVPPPLTGVCLVEITSTVVFLMSCPWIAAVSTLLGFFTMSWVTPGDLNRKVVEVDRFSSLNVPSAVAKSELGGGGLPMANGMMLLSSIWGPPVTATAVPGRGSPCRGEWRPSAPRRRARSDRWSSERWPRSQARCAAPFHCSSRRSAACR